ncbi:replicative DNA helicase [Candidatus Fermentibacteria bacterium]|nr:replicative DNA helicase [Candidatus Fermentibacteria bacterium]
MRTERGSAGFVPPQAPEAELAVLGAVMLDRNALLTVQETLDGDAFYSPANRTIYSAMLGLQAKGVPIDLVTLQESLRAAGSLDAVGGLLYLTELLEHVATAANVDYYARIVAEKAKLRELIVVATRITSECYQGPDNVERFLDEAEQAVYKVGQSRRTGRFRPLKELVTEALVELDAIHGGDRKRSGLATGFTDLDERLSGLHPGNVIIIAGRPAMGKTALALDVMRHVAVREKVPCAFFSLEMSHFEIAQRLLSAEANVDSHRLRTGRMGESDWRAVTGVMGVLSDAQLWVDDSAGLSVAELRAKARRLKSEHEIGLVVVDYLQLMSAGRGSESRQIEISEISRGLKALAKELEIPVIALSQLNRKPEDRREGKRPQLSDLRESGAIEQDADVVLLIYRPGAYDRDEDQSKTELIIAKQRNGPTGTVDLVFKSDTTRFYSASSRVVAP